MKKVSLLFMFMMIAVVSFGQTFTGVSWVNWANEPDYAATPYANPEVTVKYVDRAPITDAAAFDEVWGNLEAGYLVNKLSDTNAGADVFDLGAGDTFGAEWKAYHDNGRVYILLMYVDLEAQADAGSLGFEIAVQADGYNATEKVFRHEPTFQQGVSDGDVATQNMAYASYVPMGGGKAVFQDGSIAQWDASDGQGGWGTNSVGADAFFDMELFDGVVFWEEAAGVIKAVFPMDFGSETSVLSYLTDPLDAEGGRSYLVAGNTFAFDVKAFASIGGAATDYWWSSNVNNGYASNYYRGFLTLEIPTSISDVDGTVKDDVYYADGVVIVEGQAADLEVFNLTGSKVLSAENVTSLSLDNLINGVYIVRVNGQSSVKVVKR